MNLFRHQVVNLRSLLDDRNPRNPTRMSISRPRNMDKYGLIKGLLYNPSSPKKPGLYTWRTRGIWGRGTLRFPMISVPSFLACNFFRFNAGLGVYTAALTQEPFLGLKHQKSAPPKGNQNNFYKLQGGPKKAGKNGVITGPYKWLYK